MGSRALTMIFYWQQIRRTIYRYLIDTADTTLIGGQHDIT